MELRHLRYFVAVAEEGAVSRAAQRLLLSQPSLSRQLASLEHELGVQLLRRTARGVQLTPAGEALLQHAHQVLAMAESTREIVSGSTRVRQTVSVGVPPGADGSWLVRMADAVRGAVQYAALDYVEANSSEQLRMLRQGRLDACLVHQSPPNDHLSWKLRREPLGIAVRPEHPLAGKPGYVLHDLDGMRVLLHSQDQVPTQQHGLIAAVLAANVRPVWHFAQFTEHAYASAYVAEADAVLVGAHTAATQLAGWRWGELTDFPLAMTTWLVTERHTRTVVRTVAGVLRDFHSAQ
ncbi:MAG: LysR family transcriptional regulator [Streptosporangiales bacterium]